MLVWRAWLSTQQGRAGGDNTAGLRSLFAAMRS